MVQLDPILLAGPTAVGKSMAALLLAERLGGEIVSVDSMQVYRGMDIGTAKPAPEERQRVRHHLIDVVDVTETFDAAQFVCLARRAVAEIQLRGHVPILCGGTGLYFKAFLEGLGNAPPPDAALREQLEATPLSELLRELAEFDPETFRHIDRQNRRRVIRAVEVVRLSGKPFSQQKAIWRRGHHELTTVAPDEKPVLFFGLQREAEDLRARVDARVDAMFQQGLVAETERLLTQGLEQNRTAMQSIGYRQVVEYLHGQRSLAETVELVKTRTRQFAKRQLTWFRRQALIRWMALQPQEGADQAVVSLLAAMKRRDL